MHKGCVRDGPLIAVGHVEGFNPAQVHEGRVRDGLLIAATPVERVNPAQVHKGRIRDRCLVYSIAHPIRRIAVEVFGSQIKSFVFCTMSIFPTKESFFLTRGNLAAPNAPGQVASA